MTYEQGKVAGWTELFDLSTLSIMIIDIFSLHQISTDKRGTNHCFSTLLCQMLDNLLILKWLFRLWTFLNGAAFKLQLCKHRFQNSVHRLQLEGLLAVGAIFFLGINPSLGAGLAEYFFTVLALLRLKYNHQANLAYEVFFICLPRTDFC